jgi:hypothetical protein
MPGDVRRDHVRLGITSVSRPFAVSASHGVERKEILRLAVVRVEAANPSVGGPTGCSQMKRCLTHIRQSITRPFE